MAESKKASPTFNISLEKTENLSLINPVHLDLSQVDDDVKGYQPATHKAIERIMLLQQKQEEIGQFFRGGIRTFAHSYLF